MKKTLTFFLFFTLVLSIFFVFLPHDTVKAITYYTTTIENFDSYAEGVHSGSNSYLSWSGIGVYSGLYYGTTSTTQKSSSPLSLAMLSSANNYDRVYLNLTSPMSYNSFSCKVYVVGYGTYYVNNTLDFYNYTGVKIVSLEYVISSAGSNKKIYAYDYDAYREIYSSVPVTNWFEWGYQFNHTLTNPLNYIYYYAKDNTGNIIFQKEYRWIGLTDIGSQSLSRIELTSWNNDGYAYVSSYYDDFKLGYEDLSNPYGNGFSYDDGYVIRCMNDGATSTTTMFELIAGPNSIDWGCVLKYGPSHSDCVDSTVIYNPTRYIEYLTQYKYNEIIHDVFLSIGSGQYNYVSNNPNDYSMTLNGVDCGVADYIINYGSYGDYAIVWKDVDKLVNNEQVLFSFKSDKTTTIFSKNYYWWEMYFTFGGSGDTRVHNDINSYLDDNLDGQVWGNMELYLCWSFNESTIVDPYTPNVAEIIILDYYDNYFGIGDNDTGYMEFFNFEQLCAYTVGQSPDIYFNLTGYNNTKIKYYAYQIYYQSGTSGIFVDNGIIEVLGQYRKGIIPLSYVFLNKGKYYIMVYNATSDGMTLLDFVHRSESIGVCDTITPPVARTTEIDYNWIFALCIIIGFIVAPVIIFRDNQFFINNGAIVVALFGIIGLGICISFGLIELWFAFLVGIICIGILALKIYQSMGEDKNG
jgi:hypothetical protein